MISQIDRAELTGYPSIDKPWMRLYSDFEQDIDIEIDTKSTVWDVIERQFDKHTDIPAIEYFGRSFTRTEFKENVYQWAYILTNMGIKEDEVIPIYGCLTPDIAAITFALNMIGAVPYFLKLAISPDALAEETKEARIAIVFDGMWDNVSIEFMKEKYEIVLLYKITDSMKKSLKMIMSLRQKQIKANARIISLAKAKKIYSQEVQSIKAEFVPKRRAFITSSSGTTVGGVVKGTVATNEATIAQLYMATASGTLCGKGDRALNNLPPTASTSLNILLFLALYRGATVIIDPRVSEKDFYQQLLKYKPNFVLTTGSLWETFFNRVERELSNSKNFMFDNVKGWMVGGEGSNPFKYKRWNEILRDNGAHHGMLCGYGCSELFSSISVDTLCAQSNESNELPVMGVGIPFAGLTVGVFDKKGNELSYNQRGELWIKSKSVMKGYYNKPELTDTVLIDGWLHTGDMAQISEEGYLYIWGRMTDCIDTSEGVIFNFDIANNIRMSEKVKDCIVLPTNMGGEGSELTVHLEWMKDFSDEEKKRELVLINEKLKEILPEEIKVYGYAEYDQLPYSSTTLKKDKNAMAKKNEGYICL